VHLDLAVLLHKILLEHLILLCLVVDLYLLDLQRILLLVKLLLHPIHLLLHNEDLHTL
jgi:hypothetical protein